jgi:arsenate reductase
MKIYGIRNCSTMKKAFAWLLANARGPTWRNLPQSSKANLNETKALALLEKNANAIRRPIVEAGSRLLVGFDPDELEKALKR